MYTVNDAELAERIKRYLSEHRCSKPLVITGKSGTGRRSIFFRTLRDLGIEKVDFKSVMSFEGLADIMVPYVHCEDKRQFYFDYRLACDFVSRTGLPVVMIVDESPEINLDTPWYRGHTVRYELHLEDWLRWGRENIAAPGKTKTRLNGKVRDIVSLHPDFFETDEGLSACVWKTVSDRFYVLDGITQRWLPTLSEGEVLSIYLAAIDGVAGASEQLMSFAAEFLGNTLFIDQ